MIGPTNRTASISPDVNDPGKRNTSFDELAEAYGAAARALLEDEKRFIEFSKSAVFMTEEHEIF